MITDKQLIEQCLIPYTEHWGYIWGAAGQVWTAEKQAAATREMTKKYGAKWIGRRVCDCSGLFYWAFKELGGYIFHGSNTIWKKYCVDSTKCTLSDGRRSDGKPIRPASAVFLTDATGRHHIGLYTGIDIDGHGAMVVEAKGTINGVVCSALSHWDEVAELKDISYDGEAVRMTLRRGCKGEDVVDLQINLNALGYYNGDIDGKFGAQTEAAVKAFQSDHGLTPDGVVGPLTYAALDAAMAAITSDVTPAGTTEASDLELGAEPGYVPDDGNVTIEGGKSYKIEVPADIAMLIYEQLREQFGIK